MNNTLSSIILFTTGLIIGKVLRIIYEKHKQTKVMKQWLRTENIETQQK